MEDSHLVDAGLPNASRHVGGECILVDAAFPVNMFQNEYHDIPQAPGVPIVEASDNHVGKGPGNVATGAADADM